jgi:hypothetical protein
VAACRSGKALKKKLLLDLVAFLSNLQLSAVRALQQAKSVMKLSAVRALQQAKSVMKLSAVMIKIVSVLGPGMVWVMVDILELYGKAPARPWLLYGRSVPASHV